MSTFFMLQRSFIAIHINVQLNFLPVCTSSNSLQSSRLNMKKTYVYIVRSVVREDIPFDLRAGNG